jgi:hypothetical protein
MGEATDYRSLERLRQLHPEPFGGSLDARLHALTNGFSFEHGESAARVAVGFGG